MDKLHIVNSVCSIDGLLSLIAKYADASALCFMEAAAEWLWRAFEREEGRGGEGPWHSALAQRGLRVQLQSTSEDAGVHRLLKRLFRSLRAFSLPSRWQGPLEGTGQVLRLERVLRRFDEACEGWPGCRYLLEFAFDPTEVQETAAGDASVGPPPRPALSLPRPRIGLAPLCLEVSAQAMMTRMGRVEQSLFLSLRLGKPVPMAAEVQVMVWCWAPDCDEGAASPEAHCSLREASLPEVHRLRLPSGCTSGSITKVEVGSCLHSALVSHGMVYTLLAFSPRTHVEAHAVT
mmetsp:Transcript_15403/g.32132  ORF Transcript_15403/g.32132 Transcript_15403/m.32132 type:complete len:290 (+) Transcript_15403:33-902(+)